MHTGAVIDDFNMHHKKTLQKSLLLFVNPGEVGSKVYGFTGNVFDFEMLNLAGFKRYALPN